MPPSSVVFSLTRLMVNCSAHETRLARLNQSYESGIPGILVAGIGVSRSTGQVGKRGRMRSQCGGAVLCIGRKRPSRPFPSQPQASATRRSSVWHAFPGSRTPFLHAPQSHHIRVPASDDLIRDKTAAPYILSDETRELESPPIADCMHLEGPPDF